MLSNADLASIFEELAQLKELAGENAFAANAYRRAGQALERLATPYPDLPPAEREQALGKSMAARANSWLETGRSPELEELHAVIPEGVIRMLQVPGFGVKKVGTLWHTHGITDFDDLVARAEAGTMATLPGFGKGTQEAFLKHLATSKDRAGKWRLHRALEAAETAIAKLLTISGVGDAVPVGDVARSMEIVNEVQVLAGLEPDADSTRILKALPEFVLDRSASGPGSYRGIWNEKGSFTLFTCPLPRLAQEQVLLTGPAAFLAAPAGSGSTVRAALMKAEAGLGEYELVEKALGFYLEPELRDDPEARPGEEQRLLEPTDIKGILHCHSTYSDGQNTLRDMALRCRELGYEYFGIADHSVTAFYANGLDEDRLQQQWDEIDRLNEELAPFRIFKGIESDILNDGALDYPDKVLEKFDYIVASVHSGLRMPVEKATERLLKAIENPYTSIVGHLTGRLLLEREGYPLDMDAIIEAAARRNVSLEINASPYRLDLDWRQVRQARAAGIRLSINPDAHKLAGFDDMRYGVAVARKGGLQPQECLNTLTRDEFAAWLKSRRPA